MMSLLFVLVTATIGVALYGARRLAVTGFFISLLLAIIWFLHHASDALKLNF